MQAGCMLLTVRGGGGVRWPGCALGWGWCRRSFGGGGPRRGRFGGVSASLGWLGPRLLRPDRVAGCCWVAGRGSGDEAAGGQRSGTSRGVWVRRAWMQMPASRVLGAGLAGLGVEHGVAASMSDGMADGVAASKAEARSVIVRNLPRCRNGARRMSERGGGVWKTVS